MPMPPPGSYKLLFSLALTVGLAGCDAGRDAPQAEASDKSADADAAPTAPPESENDTPTPVEIEFDPEDKEFRKRGCDFLTAETVAKHLDVEADQLKQIKVMGCTYAWDDDQTTVEASLMMPRVHKTLDGAKQWFENATKSKTKEEIDAEFEMVKAKLDESKDLDTKVEKNTAKGITNLAKSTTPDAGITYTDVPGIGSQARVSSADGGLWIRLGNLTFQLRAYRGSKMPDVPFDPKNPKAMVKKSMEIQKQWVADTLGEREAAAKKIAPDVVAIITKAAP